MKKDFLDILYNLRQSIIEGIEVCKKNNESPRQDICNSCKSTEDENSARYDVLKTKLSDIDFLISKYLEYHK